MITLQYEMKQFEKCFYDQATHELCFKKTMYRGAGLLKQTAARPFDDKEDA